MIEQTAQRGRALFESGFFCAESVLLAIAEAQGIQTDWLPAIATGFCSGIARTCRMCGAISGGIMGLGLATGRRSFAEPVDENYALVRELISAFEHQFGSINCLDLIGCDLGTDEGQAFFCDNDLRALCARYVQEATEIAMSLLEPAKRVD